MMDFHHLPNDDVVLPAVIAAANSGVPIDLRSLLAYESREDQPHYSLLRGPAGEERFFVEAGVYRDIEEADHHLLPALLAEAHLGGGVWI